MTVGASASAAQDRLRYTQIVSPMDGTVIERGIEPGEVVTPGVQATFEGKALLTVADLSTLVVKVDLNQIDVAKVKLGQKVTLTLDALPGQDLRGGRSPRSRRRRSTPKGKRRSTCSRSRRRSTKADGAIKPGMTADVRVHIETQAERAVAADRGGGQGGAARRSSPRSSTVEKGKQKTDKVEVKIGARNDREVEIVDGLNEGEQVLIKPGARRRRTSTKM